MANLFSVPATAGYGERCRQLTGQGVAVWDVLKTCTRSGSLDSAIVADTVVPNDFQDFLQQHPAISLIGFNGATAETVFRRHVAPGLEKRLQGIECVRLPSTSPAHAAMTLEQKISAWSAALGSVCRLR